MDATTQLREALTSISVILPVINETFSLEQTIGILEDENGDVIKEYLVVVSPKKTTPEALAACERVRERLPAKVVIHRQERPFLGGACIEAIELAQGSHLVLMASDLETEPQQVKKMIALAKEHPDHIVLNSRWIREGGFTGYATTKLFLNYFFQKFFAILFGGVCSDFTYAFRICPTKLMQAIHWEELKHPFLLESLLKPLRLNVRVIEIPAIWRPREEGESQNTFVGNFPYFVVGVRIRFMAPAEVLKKGGDAA